VFVFGDEYIEGVEAFLSAYHGMIGSGKSLAMLGVTDRLAEHRLPRNQDWSSIRSALHLKE